MALPLDAISDSASRNLLATVLMEDAPAMQSITDAQVDDALHALDHRRLEQRQRALRRELADAEQRGDSAQVQTLMAEKIALDRALRQQES